NRDLRRVPGHRQRAPRRGWSETHCAPAQSGIDFHGTAKSEMRRSIQFRLNGEAVEAQVAPHETLVEVLQDAFRLFGARERCGQGLCGCCTVLVNGRAVSGCLYLAPFIDGTNVATIEGYDASDQLSPEQEAFIETGAFQCGYCTSGFIIMATQLLDEHPEPTD